MITREKSDIIRKEDGKVERMIRIGTVTEASRARRALLERGIRTRLTKAEATKDGCIWGLKVDAASLLMAVKTLGQCGISYEIQ